MRFIFLFVLLAIFSALFSQQVNERNLFLYEDVKANYWKNSNKYTAFKESYPDSISGLIKLNKNKKTELFGRPIYDFQMGFENGDQSQLLGIGAGAELRMNKNKWNVGFSYLFNYQKFGAFQERFITTNKVIPGMGFAKLTSTNLRQSSYANAFVNFKVNKYFKLEAGLGRNFIGDGYRSLLLSDVSNASPYLKIQTTFWKFQYTNLFSSHRNIFQVEGRANLYQKKYSATHYLDWKATRWLSIGLFETIIWAADEGNYSRGFDIHYANPFIFYRPVEFALGSSDNALVGANLKVTVAKNQVFYSQLLFDEFLLDELKADISQWRNPNDSIRSGWWANKYGIQLGWTSFDLFKIKGLQTRVEFNVVRPYTYAHSNTTQAYSHDNLSLAHPLGSNFYEVVSRINYQVNRWNFAFNYHYNKQGQSSFGENFGDNLQFSNTSRNSEYENELLQGRLSEVKFLEASVSYLLVPKIGATLTTTYISRVEKTPVEQLENTMVYLRLHANLFNKYFDF